MNIKIGEQIQLLRKEKGLSQEELAEVFHVSNQSVSKWETGQTYPDISIIPDIAKYFGVSVDELLGIKPVTSVNNLHLQMISLISSINDDGEKIDAIYKLARFASNCIGFKQKHIIDESMVDKRTWGQSMVQTYGKDFGGLAIHGYGSIYISSFKEYPTHGIPELRDIYQELISICNINVLKVLQALFYHQKDNIHNGLTIEELMEKTHLSEVEIKDAFNNLDIISYKDDGKTRWRLNQIGIYPLLVTLTMTTTFFKNN